MTSTTKTLPPPGAGYRGRFAPSPTGPLHFGSLVAALASCLEARHQGGEWWLRMEDVDRPRCRPGAADAILRSLERLGFAWDGPVLYQSARSARYREVLAGLQAAGRAYPCACTRKDLAGAARTADGGIRYPGTCRAGLPPGKSARAWRLRVDAGEIWFEDRIQGVVREDVAQDAGDFILLRADGCFAYQLAVVVDDADQGITDIVRGADLLDSTPRQRYLQSLLGWPRPGYAHVPVALDGAGEKLSKQTRAAPVDEERPVPALLAALDFLGQSPPRELAEGTIDDVWTWARTYWNLARVPRLRGQPAGHHSRYSLPP
ncbi:MAG: tRNA glutamyl-Q(34) synthetase GluQRS [Proteobacteria bacterium]|nr:tRNA glutamyl-Q(34) synthetase GluQRS [Pseudomonadota bacterium]HQR03872.1 tRNA glutamyl-Q(34) synthetase GluQRS [Rhodocyclaceae bacterium]